MVAETSAAVWNYHLRRIVDGRMFFGGGAPAALCGAPLGWDTLIPLSSWGGRSHIPETWCTACWTVAFGDAAQPSTHSV